MTENAINKKSKGISPIWTLPVIALAICCWLLYESYQNSGVEIVVYFEDASGITPGKTQVMSMGLPIGIVKKMDAELEHNRIKTIVKMDRGVEDFLVEDTLFWVVRPEISAAKIYGLETILSGSYISIQPGEKKIPKHEYNGLSSPPPISEKTPGLHFYLEAKALQSIQEGSGIYYKNIQVGSVQSYALQPDDSVILINCYIEEQYSHLIKEESIFSNASGVSISGKLTNLKFRMESLASLIMGGILIQTPDDAIADIAVKNGHKFRLYEDLEAASFGVPMTLKLASGGGITEGVTKVIYRGIEAGFVKTIEINNDQQRYVTAHILLDPRAELILKKGTRFWLAGPEISSGGVKNMSTLFSGPFITFQPGEGEDCNHFEILPEPPALEPLRAGKSFTVTLEEPSTITKGSPVLYRNIQVGEIIDVSLKSTTSYVTATIYIYEQYLNYISTRSVFWNASGIKVNASIKGVQVESGSLSSIVQGGISFLTPEIELSQGTETPERLHNFTLHKNFKAAKKHLPELAPKGTYFQILAEDMGSLSIDSPILYKKIEIGRILDFQLSDEHVLLDCYIKPNYSKYLNNTSLFYNVSGVKITGGPGGLNVSTGSLNSIISGGINLITPSKIPTKSKIKKIYPLYPSLDDALAHDAIDIVVTFKDTEGLKIGTPLRFHGIDVGKVTRLNLDNIPQAEATIRVNKSVEKFFRATTQIWLAKPDIGLSGIKNADALVLGPSITFKPGSGKQTYTFTASDKPAKPDVSLPSGLNLILQTKHLGSLTIGAPVYYRQIEVGKVTGYDLEKSFQQVLVYINIENPYTPIIREETKFWNVSGARIEGGIFSGVTVKTESVKSIIRGGISFATPDNKNSGAAVQNGQHFTLHEDYENSWLDWNPNALILEEDNYKTSP